MWFLTHKYLTHSHGTGTCRPQWQSFLRSRGSQPFGDDESAAEKRFAIGVFYGFILLAGCGLDYAFNKAAAWFAIPLESWEEEGYVAGIKTPGKTYLMCGSDVVITIVAQTATLLHAATNDVPQQLKAFGAETCLYKDELITDEVIMCAWEKTLNYTTALKRREKPWVFSGQGQTDFQSSERLRFTDGLMNEFNNKNCTVDAVISALLNAYLASEDKSIPRNFVKSCKSIPDDKSFELKRDVVLELISNN